MRSSIEIFNIRTRQMRVVWQTPELFEAPNWSPTGRAKSRWTKSRLRPWSAIVAPKA